MWTGFPISGVARPRPFLSDLSHLRPAPSSANRMSRPIPSRTIGRSLQRVEMIAPRVEPGAALVQVLVLVVHGQHALQAVPDNLFGYVLRDAYARKA